jgi:hypothetical protein
MSIWAAAAWGLVGGLCVEALELYARIHRAVRWSWRRPVRQGLAGFVTAVCIRVGVGAAVAAAAAGSRQVSGPLAAFGLGVCAPLVVQRLARAVPLTDAAEPKAQQSRAGSRGAMRPADALDTGSAGEEITVQDADRGAL